MIQSLLDNSIIIIVSSIVLAYIVPKLVDAYTTNKKTISGATLLTRYVRLEWIRKRNKE